MFKGQNYWFGMELLSRVESEVVATQKPVRDFNNLLHLGRLCA
jgi:hypothetical protein